MTTLLQTLLNLLRPAPAGAFVVPGALMDSAQARAGHNPAHARELRRAAVAALRVVR